jgi:hypothetical protein
MKVNPVGIKLTNLRENKMSSNHVNRQNMKLEVLVLPVSNVDGAKGFYETLGWRLDADFVTSKNFRFDSAALI